MIALIQARPTQQKSLSGKTAIVLDERGMSQLEVIVAWSYPGRVESHQFLYPKQVQAEVAKLQARHYRIRRLVKHQPAGVERGRPAHAKAIQGSYKNNRRRRKVVT